MCEIEECLWQARRKDDEGTGGNMRVGKTRGGSLESMRLRRGTQKMQSRRSEGEASKVEGLGADSSGRRWASEWDGRDWRGGSERASYFREEVGFPRRDEVLRAHTYTLASASA